MQKREKRGDYKIKEKNKVLLKTYIRRVRYAQAKEESKSSF
jgi:hypothetical protein